MQRAVQTVKYEWTNHGMCSEGKLPQVLSRLGGVPHPSLCPWAPLAAAGTALTVWPLSHNIQLSKGQNSKEILQVSWTLRAFCSILPDLGEKNPKPTTAWVSCSSLLYKAGVKMQALPKTQVMLFSQWIQIERVKLDYLAGVRNVLYLAMLDHLC